MLDYPIGARLIVKELFYYHMCTYYGNGLVFQNHRLTGPKIVRLEEFAQDRKIIQLDEGVEDIYEYQSRVRESVAKARRYHLLTYNCEHAVNYVREGKLYSTQINAIVGIASALILTSLYQKSS